MVVGRKSFVGKAVLAASIAFFLFLSTGCQKNVVRSAEVNREIDAFGVALHSGEDLKTIDGVRAVREPCVKGYEYVFDTLDFTIGYGHDGHIRKITTRNAKTRLFGIAPGVDFNTAKGLIAGKSFAQGDTPYKFTKGGYLLTFLVDEKGVVFGITLEVLD